MAWAMGCMPPPPAPCRMRKMSSMGSDGAAPHRKLEMVKMVMQRTKKLRRPMTLDAQRAHGQHDGVGHQVAGQHPGALIGAGAQRAGDMGQGHVGDGGVEHLHEGRQRHGHGDQPGIDPGLPQRGEAWARILHGHGRCCRAGGASRCGLNIGQKPSPRVVCFCLLLPAGEEQAGAHVMRLTGLYAACARKPQQIGTLVCRFFWPPLGFIYLESAAGAGERSSFGVRQPMSAMASATACMTTMKAAHAGHLPMAQKAPGTTPAAVPPT